MQQFTARDLLAFEFLSDPQLSPRGGLIAYVNHRVRAEEDRYCSHIMLVDETSAKVRTFAGGIDRHTHPRWSPDGQYLAFLSNRPVDGKDLGVQVWVARAEGGEAAPLTSVKGGVTGFVWSPQGDRLAVVALVDPDEGIVTTTGQPDPEPADELDRLFKKYTSDVKEITKLRYKFDGAGFLNGRRNHVGVVAFRPDDLFGAVRMLPSVVDVTPGDFDHRDPTWSPDGRYLAVSACRVDEPDCQIFTDIWVFSADGQGESVKVTHSRGPAMRPSWSSDGGRIAFLGNFCEVAGHYANDRLLIAAVPEIVPGAVYEINDLTAGHDVSFGDAAIGDMKFAGPPPVVAWTPDGRYLYHVTCERGTTQLVRTDAQTGESHLVTTGDRVIFNASFDRDVKRAAIVSTSATDPGAIAVVELGECALPAGTYQDAVLDASRQRSPEKLLVPSNVELLSSRKVYTPVRLKANAGDGPDIDTWVILPEATGKVPTVLQIHGGPTAMYTGTFFFEFQLLAAAGFAVVFTNPRGSSGYGESFRAAIVPGWGDLDYQDIMAGLDKALAEFPQLDAERLGVAGGSYGGYMTNWIIGHTDRFRAAVSMRCVSNVFSFYGTSDVGYMWADRLGEPWESPEKYRRESPLSYLHHAQTPTLFIHSEQDYRCSIEQGEQAYVALRKRGVPTEFVRYPDENHDLSRTGKPWHRIHRLGRIADWFVRYL